MAAAAAQSAPGSPPYGPLNPTPDSDLRTQFSPDRPDKAQGPITVDAGHWQIEADWANYSWSNQEGTTARQLDGPNILLKYGLGERSDVEIQLPGYNIYEQKSLLGSSQRAHGAGDMSLNFKYNLFGDFSSDTPANQSFAIIPMIKLPTAPVPIGNGKLEGQIALPYQFSLPSNWNLTLQNNDGLRVGRDGKSYQGDYQGIVNLAHPLIWSTLTASIEYAYDTGPATGHAATIDAALQWYVTNNLALDVGDYIGLNANAPAENPYAGIAMRF